ncbi:HAMP domain-containing sensor histidine kinase [uncultured Winogradskyella sp.]|uniref:sensor histidine kinase n=1 Tax=uncultured Winogradskyella sp. TaxID=395353 RepID=UPI00262CB1C1|nr:HAMP domain-containing sensor histidine kinase [uncultured Winogradskyella sp.]
MTLSLNRNVIRWIIIVSSFIIISLILWNTYVFFQYFKAEERAKMKSWTFAYNEYVKDLTSAEPTFNEVAQFIVLDSTITTPMLLIDTKSNNIEGSRNIGVNIKANDSIKKILDSSFIYRNREKLITKFSKENEPFIIKSQNKVLYYGNSPLLNKLKYYPLALLLIILLFAAVVYFFYRSSKNAQQNKLWTGMAKETAHQIGTPLSSLVGWTEILKTENINPDYIVEIEKDIDRLQTITDRFSKIGSIPTLEKVDIVEVTKTSYDYLKSRSSKLINFESNIPEQEIPVNLNTELYSWTIENLVKNAIDAMKGKGDVKLELFQTEKQVFINISDTGKGISKQQFTKIFEPGYTTKKRGWGLGLSLAKRIIEDYHNGKIKVLTSEIGKGTTIQIAMKQV